MATKKSPKATISQAFSLWVSLREELADLADTTQNNLDLGVDFETHRDQAISGINSMMCILAVTAAPSVRIIKKRNPIGTLEMKRMQKQTAATKACTADTHALTLPPILFRDKRPLAGVALVKRREALTALLPKKKTPIATNKRKASPTKAGAGAGMEFEEAK